MAEKELRRMSRTELIEIIYALQQENDALRGQADALQAKLDEREIKLRSAGSIAEASLALNRVFEDAQAAADQYLASVLSQAEAGGLDEAGAGYQQPAASHARQQQAPSGHDRQQASAAHGKPAARQPRQAAPSPAAQSVADYAEEQRRQQAAREAAREAERRRQANEAASRRGPGPHSSSGWQPGKYDAEAAARDASRGMGEAMAS